MRFGFNGKRRLIFAAGVIFAAMGTVARAQSTTPTTDTVLSRMDSASRTFTGMQASIDRLIYSYFAEDESKDNGKVFLASKNGETRIRIDITDPGQQSLVIEKGWIRLYNKRLNQLQEREIGKTQQHDLAEFLLVGFGQSGADIRRLYDPAVRGTDKIDGKPVVILELKPKAGSEAASKITSITLWLDSGKWIPVRTKVTQPSKDTHTVTYRDLKMGAPGNKSFDLDLPKDVKRIPF
ncbi:MAG TPA: hypothetical protein VFY29_19795 [Terriglobia bacterium]|nr:hypothetical protein [Terriglobia bacterium]